MSEAVTRGNETTYSLLRFQAAWLLRLSHRSDSYEKSGLRNAILVRVASTDEEVTKSCLQKLGARHEALDALLPLVSASLISPQFTYLSSRCVPLLQPVARMPRAILRETTFASYPLSREEERVRFPIESRSKAWKGRVIGRTKHAS